MSGKSTPGQAIAAFGDTELSAARQADANYHNRINPNSKLAAIKTGAAATAGSIFNDTNQDNSVHGAST
jgi:hypothetical protein